MRAEQQQEARGGIVFVGQQRELADALELVNENAGEVAFFRFADFGMGDDDLHRVINVGLLVWVQALVGAAKGRALDDLDFCHGSVALAFGHEGRRECRAFGAGD